MTDFESLGIGGVLAERLRRQGIEAPVKVQILAIPEILRGRDVIVSSATGTGKTLAYLLPLLERLEEQRALDGPRQPQALVIAPTQELAMQIARVAASLAEGVKIASCIGGASLQRQIERLKEKPALVIGTAGRLMELYRMNKLKLHQVGSVVIDEVDQLLSLGDGETVDALLRPMPRERQTILVTATVTDDVRRRAEGWMRDPLAVEGETMREAAAAVRHQFMLCQRRDKIDVARRLVRTLNPEAAILFVSDEDRIEETEAKLARAGLPAGSLYGEAGKRARAEAMREFAAGRLRLLIATDIAARGLDVPGITHIINIDPPPDAVRYAHRAGRTGRMGRGGTVITLATPAELQDLRRAANKLGLALEEMELSRGQWIEAPRDSAAKAAAASGKQREPKRAGEAKPLRVSPAKERQKAQKERHRDRKNKGAPRWLKDKR